MVSRFLCISAAVFAFPVSAQQGPPPDALGADGSRDNPYRMPAGYRGSSGDEQALELNRRVPGYAGIYFDRERNRHIVRIKRGQPLPLAASARKAVAEVLGVQEMEIERAAYEEADRDMAELIELKDRISRSWVGGEMSGLGINQRTGRVTVGVRDPKNMPGTEAMLKRLSVPSDAIELLEMSVVFEKKTEKVVH